MTNKKKKVLFLIHTLQVGGAEKVLVNLVNNMNKEKFDITVMTVINTGAFRKELDKDIKYKTIFDIKILNQKNNKSGNLYSNGSKIKKVLGKIYQFVWRHLDCKKIYKKYIKEDYDIEIAFLEGISAKIIANSNNKKSKKISWIHVDLLNERKTEKFFKNRDEEINTYDKFDKIICVSEFVKKQLEKKTNINKEKIIVQYNPIDVEYIEKLSNKKINDIKKEKFTLIGIGRLSIQKGFDRLLRVVKRLNEEKYNFALWIIGVGSEETKLKEFIKNNDLNNVKLLGYKKNPYKYIKNADLLVCSSRAEGFSTVVSEAIILQKPIITTDCSGMKEMLGDNNEYGIVCNNDEEALFLEIRNILSNKEQYNYYLNKVKERKNIFNLKKSIERIEELIGE